MHVIGPPVSMNRSRGTLLPLIYDNITRLSRLFSRVKDNVHIKCIVIQKLKKKRKRNWKENEIVNKNHYYFSYRFKDVQQVKYRIIIISTRAIQEA